ncbi:MAG: hypothetical protein KAT65_03980 [Methanophagales archaeon]|nr:hypothetical protein [Methanophagales archaeon]
MSCLGRVEIIEALLPGLIALTSILVVAIAFLLERYISFKNFPKERKPYQDLIKFMTFALIIGGIAIILSLFYLHGIIEKITLSIYYLILALFVVNILVIIIGTIKTVKEILS